MYLSAMCYPVIFYPPHLYVFILICQYYVVLLERTNKDIIVYVDIQCAVEWVQLHVDETLII